MNKNKLVAVWKNTLKEKIFIKELIITIIFFVLISGIFTSFLTYNETRTGFTLHDPILQLLFPVELTVIIFILIYASVFTALIILLYNPSRLLFTLQVYSLVLIIRMLLMYLMPLNPPEGLLPLQDPFVELFGTGETLSRDLFFSGHVATLFMLFLVFDKKIYKSFFLASTILVGTALLFQHVHYTIDVITAPFFVYASYKIVFNFKQKLKLACCKQS
ncbi:MAG: hypothetical protein IIB83_02930 [Bacteroidetes bacterium]|nr:hypothetical protein [Bacteroidota bacterium]